MSEGTFNLWKKNEDSNWYFRKLVKNERFSFSLGTTCLKKAQEKRDEFLKIIEETGGLKIKRRKIMTLEDRAKEVKYVVSEAVKKEPPRLELNGEKVYFIQAENGLIKIGRSIDLENRFHRLRTMSPIELKLVGYQDCKPLTEIILHGKFKHLRSHGEWFHPGDELLEYISSLQ